MPTIAEFRARPTVARAHETLLDEVLERARLDAAEHVFTSLYEAPAREAARRADAALSAGQPLPSSLAGLPVSIKDLYDVAGEPTLAGSIVRRGAEAAGADAPAVARLRAAGAAIVGKTNMTEFAFSGVGINPHYGTPRNPADAKVARIPGGSSSGAAVSVALGLAVAGLGSDTGGSIRIPAALCGIVGFKNTQSRTPLAGAFPLAESLDTVCAMTRSVADCVAVDAVLAGAPLEVKARQAAGLRLALPRTLLLDALDATVAAAFERSLASLSRAGAKIVEIEVPEFNEVGALNTPASWTAIEAWATHKDLLSQQRGRFDPRVAARIELGRGVLASEYLALRRRRAQWTTRVNERLASFDALVCPTVPIVAPEMAPLVANDEAFFKTNGFLLRNTYPVNLFDGCAFSLPCHAAGELPVGLMLAAPNGSDAALAGVALAVEAALASTVAAH
jgi:aspartyl-tRNA(Asn)/glutamyl-tRNA(Gln) amidotransferase subunit A